MAISPTGVVDISVFLNQIAILSHSGFNSYDVGASWWTIDHHLGIRHSQINAAFINRADLRRYNTIIIPSGSNDVDGSEMKVLTEWVKQGELLSPTVEHKQFSLEGSIGSVRRIQDTFEKSKDHDLVIQREWLAKSEKLDMNVAMAHTVNVDNEYPWNTDATAYNKQELAKRDKWQALFMPSGAMVSAGELTPNIG